MGNSASVTVNGITLSLADAAKIGDMPEVKAYREQQAEAKRVKMEDWVLVMDREMIFRVTEQSDQEEFYGTRGHLGSYSAKRLIKITDPDEIATLNRITSRMGE